jgi:hypothetical protein
MNNWAYGFREAVLNAADFQTLMPMYDLHGGNDRHRPAGLSAIGAHRAPARHIGNALIK